MTEPDSAMPEPDLLATPADSRSEDAPAAAEENSGAASPRMGRFLLKETLQVVIPALVLALLVHLFLAQATVVFGQSMEPNLHQNERLIVEKFSYHLRTPDRNDIVVVNLPEMSEMLVKRIVALPGETVEIRRGVVYVDGQPMREPYPHDRIEYDMHPITLGPLSYFVLGDNRGNSNDSRFFGPVTRDEIVGRVWLRYWPLDHFIVF